MSIDQYIWLDTNTKELIQYDFRYSKLYNSRHYMSAISVEFEYVLIYCQYLLIYCIMYNYNNRENAVHLMNKYNNCYYKNNKKTI